jgi:hypothetical protein
MWKLYKYDGRFIQGELVSKHTSQNAALKKAKEVIGHLTEVEEVRVDEHLIWLDGEGGTPMGVIVQKAKKRRTKKIST